MSRPRLEVADIFRRFGAAWRAANEGHLSLAQRRVMSADRALPHRGARRPCRALRGLRAHAHRLQLLPQPPLPQVPVAGGAGLARGARGGAVAGPLLPRRVHPAGRDRRHRLPEQGQGLRPPVQGGGRDADHHRCRPEAPRRRDRRHRGAAHLGAEARPSPARPLHRAGRRHLPRRRPLGRLPAGLLPAGAGALAPVPAAVPRRPRRGARQGRAGGSSATSPG